MSRSRRRSRRTFIGVAVVAVGGAMLAPMAATANAATSARSATPGTQYAVTTPSCDAPTPGHAACNSIKLVRTSKNTPGAQPLITGSFTAGPAGGYTPGDLATAYGFDPDAAAGATQTVGIVDAYNDPNALADLNAFNSHYGLPAETATSLQIVNQSGATSPLPVNDAGWASEISLDLDSVRGVCHKCKIILVETTTNSYANLEAGVATAVAMGATEISNSYGGPEQTSWDSSVVNSFTAAYNAPGVVITASTGDHGWRDWDKINPVSATYPSDGPEVPSSLPNVVAVGGTTLNLNSSNARTSETVWNENGTDDTYGWNQASAEGASGGGCSIKFPVTPWQSGMAGFGATGCGSSRLAADVSAIADPYTGYDIYDSYPSGTWATYGGTSLASPVVAAIWALAGGSGGVDYPSLTLYGHASHSSPYYDVTSGGNSYCAGDAPATCATSGPLHGQTGGSANPNGTAYHTVDCAFAAYPSTDGTVRTNHNECYAATGFDGPSGVGTPNGVSGFKPTGPAGVITKPSIPKLHQSAAFSIAAADPFPGGSVSVYNWNWGDGSATGSGTSPHHTYTKAGTYTITVHMTDSYSQEGVASASITVGKKPVINASGPSSLKKGKKGTFKVSGHSPNTGGVIATYSWKFGDGSKGSGPKVKHAFAKAGTYKVKVIAKDNGGQKAKQKLTVTVK